MRVVVTGGAGFIGRATVRRLLAEGADVLVLDRDSSRTAELETAGATVATDDLGSIERLVAWFRGADAVVHAAGIFRIGIRATERPAMSEANVAAAERTFDAAAEAGVPHLVHVSTYGVYGNTRGRVVDESYRRDPTDPFTSWYDRTKQLAHHAAEARRAAGAPVSIVLLGAAYGKGDPSGLGDQVRRATLGRLPAIGSPTLGVSWSHVDDLADGITRVVRGARPGGDWNLGGELGTLRDAIDLACAVVGRRPPRLVAPGWALLALARLGPGVCSALGLPADLAEAVRSTDGVTYWASHEKAARELGYAPRPMREGFAATYPW